MMSVQNLANAAVGDARAADSRVGADAFYLQQFAVRYEFPVVFTHALFDPANAVLIDTLRRREPDKRHRVAVFMEQGLASHWPGLARQIVCYAEHHGAGMQLVGVPELLPGGEQVKNDPSLVSRLQRRLCRMGIDRHSYVLAIGGGAFLDLMGFVAATTHRGLRHIRVPTTVLAQNDSGVGVKNGVNAFGLKNLLGCFAPPFAVLNDADFLRTLPRRERIAGMAEAVKVALIRDAAFFNWLEAHGAALAAGDDTALARLIRRCAELHMRQIGLGGDPFETSSARPLDYGHWAAHKLESLSAHALNHGEAVAIGLALDTRYSVQTGMLAHGVDDRVHALLRQLGFALWHSALDSRLPGGEPALLRGLEDFREHLGGELTITLLRDIGVGEEVHHMDDAQISLAIDWLRQREGVP